MMAFIAFYQDGGLYGCSGTVIAPNVVLTAAHCAGGEWSGYEVITGTLNWIDIAARQVSGVSRIIVDPNFDRSTLDGDAALLVLDRPTTAPVIPLATYPADARLLSPGTGADISGWGATAYAPIATQLQWGQMVLQAPNYCADYGGGSFDPGREICAVDPAGVDTICNGDSGAPLLSKGSDGTWVEIGAASHGVGLCNPAVPGVFTRTDAIARWAQSWINAVSPPAPGTYRGRTGQDRPIGLRVAPSRQAVLALSLSARLRCTRRRAVVYGMPPGSSHALRTLNTNYGRDFKGGFRDRRGAQYRIAAAFTNTGAASGTLAINWRSRQYGACHSGRLRWSARLTLDPAA